MSKLLNQARKSNLMRVVIQLNGEEIAFNLYTELRIDEDLVMDSLKIHPQQYAFLSILHKNSIKEVSDLEAELDTLKGELYTRYKTQPGIGARAKSKDLAIADLESDKTYLKAITRLNEAKHSKNILETCVKSFEVRKDLIQTLSANMRKEI